MTTEEKRTIKSLIKLYCIPSSLTYRMGSYGLKELFERLSNTYIAHDEIKDMMQECGIKHIRQQKGCESRYYRMKIKESIEIPPVFRGRGYQQYRYKDG